MINRLIAAVAVLAACVAAPSRTDAQGNVSPYSKFGYGILDNNATAAQKQMGGVGYAMNSGRQINVMNPASYASIDTLTFLFDMGVDFTTIKSSEGAVGDINPAKERRFGGGLDYLTMQFPLGKYMGASIGLLPFSSVGYSFGSEIANGVNSRQGMGGLNQLYVGVAGRLFQGFSVGANFSYLFGTNINDVYVTPSVPSTGHTSLFEQVTRVRDWRVQLGVQYHVNVNSDNRLGIGLTYSPGKTLLGNAYVVKYAIDADVKPDTLGEKSLRHNADLPATYGAGVNWTWRNKLMVEADFTYQPWANAKNVSWPTEWNVETTRFANRYQVGLGASYTPSVRGGYFRRVTYRAGAFFNRDYVMVGDNNVRDYGVSCGFGFPTVSDKSIINLGFEYRHRQAHPNPMVKENYFCVRLGINFNELWFFQNKLR